MCSSIQIPYNIGNVAQTDGFLQPCDYFEMPDGDIIDWEDRTHGDDGILLEDFEQIMMEDRGSFATEQAWQEAANGTTPEDNADDDASAKSPTSPKFSGMGTLFRLYEVVSLYMCVPPYKYRKILGMLLNLMKLW